MRSLVVKRSVVVRGRKTSVSLEEPFWQGLKEIAVNRHVTLSALLGGIDEQRQQGNLSSVLRLFVLEFYRSRAPKIEEDHNDLHEPHVAESNQNPPAGDDRAEGYGR